MYSYLFICYWYIRPRGYLTALGGSNNGHGGGSGAVRLQPLQDLIVATLGMTVVGEASPAAF